MTRTEREAVAALGIEAAAKEAHDAYKRAAGLPDWPWHGLLDHERAGWRAVVSALASLRDRAGGADEWALTPEAHACAAEALKRISLAGGNLHVVNNDGDDLHVFDEGELQDVLRAAIAPLRSIACGWCSGAGTRGGKRCPDCAGKGTVPTLAPPAAEEPAPLCIHCGKPADAKDHWSRQRLGGAPHMGSHSFEAAAEEPGGAADICGDCGSAAHEYVQIDGSWFVRCLGPGCRVVEPCEPPAVPGREGGAR